MADRLQITELDFDAIKNNLKLFLQQQNQFTDYDFEGSGLNILIDILAYNTHYQAYYLNMIGNEAFLDTAILRDSVVSHAKSLGYTPHSKKSSRATIDFTVKTDNNNPGTLTIPRGYGFLSNQIDGKSYKFIVLNDVTVTKSNTDYFFSGLNINEGQLINYSYIQDQLTNPNQIFQIPDNSIDVDSLMVSVANSTISQSLLLYNRVDDITDITNTSPVYFVQEEKNQYYQIYFGDDVIGKKIPDGGVVYINYLVTNSSDANKANNFVSTSSIVDSNSETLTDFIIDPISSASGGTDIESVDSIKYNAPIAYTSQNRLVTAPDYQSYIQKKYPIVDSISVWGGEDLIPPVYGKVFISIKPKDGYYISESEKNNIINDIIQPKSIVTVKSEIIDPIYLYLLINTTVRYDPSRTKLTRNALSQLIRDNIISYNTTYLNKFSSTFIISKLDGIINDIDTNSIIGCDTVVRVEKRFLPTLGLKTNYEIDFNVPLAQRTPTSKLTTNEFYVYDNSLAQRKVVLEEVPSSSTGVISVNVLDAGIDYISPTISIVGDGIGATAEAVLNNGRIQKINIINPGSDYNKATINITDSKGFGASVIPVLNTRSGILRLIYYDILGNRVIVNSNIGTIDYDKGIITLNDLNILSVVASDGIMRIDCPLNSGMIQTSRNSIISIDDTDISSIIINLETV